MATLWQTKACVCICIPLLALDRICKGQSDAKSITNSFTSFTIIQQLQCYFPLANRIMIIIASGSKEGCFVFGENKQFRPYLLHCRLKPYTMCPHVYGNSATLIDWSESLWFSAILGNVLLTTSVCMLVYYLKYWLYYYTLFLRISRSQPG